MVVATVVEVTEQLGQIFVAAKSANLKLKTFVPYESEIGKRLFPW